ncbi:hypothetical protein EFE27_08130 [Leuconostoc citreum]|uniref:McrC family protein n=1 Tax=Leuconostoc citreum TaxID=33964 RepID=UPI00218250D8|nr:McrC family protein [Leuconostoc citreum]MCS8595928.1 hypothetical protein [Leuconostoc citreum]
MKIISIFENSAYTVPDEYITPLVEFLENNKKLPVHVHGNTLTFDEYVIGSITINDLSILINPRINKMKPNHYFEMQLYNEGLLDDKLSTSMDEESTFGIQQNLTTLFLKKTAELVSQGIEGAFIKVSEETNVIKGRILINEISPLRLIQDQIPVEYDIHTHNTAFNKIIKLALNKILLLINDNKIQSRLFSQVNAYFEDVDVFESDLPQLILELESKFYYENPYYPTVIGLAIKILNDLKLNIKNNKVMGSSYLVNSNNLFEKYARKVLTNSLQEPIKKWAIPKTMGKISFGSKSFEKSYIPDILVDYHDDLKTAFAVLDAKNKDILNPQNIAKLPDLYQILFYCYTLKTDYGGLIYPAFNPLFKSAQISVDSFKENNLFAFTIDFSKPLKQRNFDFVNAVKQAFGM